MCECKVDVLGRFQRVSHNMHLGFRERTRPREEKRRNDSTLHLLRYYEDGECSRDWPKVFILVGTTDCLPWHVVRVFVVFVEVAAVAFQLRFDATSGGILVLGFAVVPYRVLIGEGYLLTGALDPVARSGDQVVRVVFAEFV